MASCKKDSVIPAESYFRHYFPFTAGSYTVFDCDSIVYNDFTGEIDTFRFQIREVYQSTFTDNAGREAIRIERWKLEPGSSWYLKDVWTLVKTDMQVEKVEEDVRFIRLMFPVKAGKKWNMNAQNSLAAREVEIVAAHVPFNNGTLQFDSTLTVKNTDPENLVSDYRNTEVYAVNKGLVYRQFKDIRFVVPTPAIKSGVIFTMRATEIYVK